MICTFKEGVIFWCGMSKELWFSEVWKVTGIRKLQEVWNEPTRHLTSKRCDIINDKQLWTGKEVEYIIFSNHRLWPSQISLISPIITIADFGYRWFWPVHHHTTIWQTVLLHMPIFWQTLFFTSGTQHIHLNITNSVHLLNITNWNTLTIHLFDVIIRHTIKSY